MKQEQVKALLGEPESTETQGTDTCWYYQQGQPMNREGDRNPWRIPRGSILFSGKDPKTAKVTDWRGP
jgi:hypothetical protein